MLRPLCLALALIAPGAATADRSLSGSVTFLARIALPEGAEVAVEVRGIDGGVIVHDAFPAGGVPATFVVPAPETDLIVSAGLMREGQMIWAAATQVVPAGTGDADLGELVSSRAPGLVGFSLVCGPVTVTGAFTQDGGVHMRWGAETAELVADLVMSGRRYSDQRSFIWLNGEQITVGLQGVELPCTAVPAGRFPILGGGNEPGWQVEIAPDQITYNGAYGTVRRDLQEPAVIGLPDGWLYAAGDPPMAVLAQHGPAFDTMTGMPHPWRLTVLTGDTILTGSGGAPEGLLIGAWRFEDLGGQGVPDGPSATLRIEAEGRATGFGGCNRYTGGYLLTGEGLSFGPMAATRMACRPAAMDLERRVFDALGRTDRFAIDETGALVLFAADAPIARLRR